MYSQADRIEYKLDRVLEGQWEALSLLAELADARSDATKAAALTSRIKQKTQQLRDAVAAIPHPQKGTVPMSKPIDDLIAQVTAENTVIDGAIALINGIPAMIQDAVAKATANGATAAELAPLTDLATSIQAKTKALADAVVAGTPAAPAAPQSQTKKKAKKKGR